MVNKQIIVLIIIAVVVLKCSESQIVPSNPCPNLFQYLQSDGVIYGRMEFPNDLSGFYELSVNMSMAVFLRDNRNIRLELKTPPNDLPLGRSVVYNVYFPIQTVLPKPTRIEFNNRVYCAGPPEEVRPGSGVTNMWATTYYGTSARPVNRPITSNTPNEIEVIQSFPLIEFTIPPNFQFTQSTTPTPVVFSNPPSSSSVPVTFRPSPTFETPTAKPANAFFDTNSAPFTSVEVSTKAPIFVDRRPLDTECGLTSVTQQLVVNGDKVENGQYPWMVAIMYKQNNNYKYRCTGSLVSTRHIITAAHCVWFINAPLVPLAEMLLVFGKNDIRNWADGAFLRNVQNITAHPNYTNTYTRSGHCDIAILTTKKAVEYSSSIRPLCIWKDDANLDRIVGKEGIVVGWGMDETGRNLVTEAKKVNLPVVSSVTCLRSDIRFNDITSGTTFCAGNRDGSGPCTGDSGAGFAMNRGGRWFLRGVVSTPLNDSNTCDLDNYFVFADAAKVKNWITKVIA